MEWTVQMKGSIWDKDDQYELSVIHADDCIGRKSWGWGGERKIILFGTGVGANQLNPRTVESIEFALGVADKLAEALNGVT